MFQWVMAATLICGASVFSSCTNSDDNPSPPAKKNRTEFINHTRANLKELAENLNFNSWEVANDINFYFNQYVLNNPFFEKTIVNAFMQQATQTVKPVEEGSELEQMGYKTYGIVDFTEFNYRFTMNEEGTGFDVEPAEDFEMIITSFDPVTQQLKPKSMKLILKAGGSSFLTNMAVLGTDEFAVIGKIPTEFEFSISTNATTGEWHDLFTGAFRNDVKMDGTSQYINRMTDAFNLSGTISSSLQKLGDSFDADAATVTFAIGQDPATHEAGAQFGFIHNGKELIHLRGVMKNLNGQTDYSQFNSSISIADAMIAIMAGNSIEEGTITLLNDLTTTIKVTDCAKVIKLQKDMTRARRNYADEATIEGYTQQLNQLVSGSMTCAHQDMQIPMQLKTIKFGVDYWAMPALNFGDENGYVAITDMLDPESIQYMINIADHAAAPMQRSIVTVRQLMQYIQMLTGDIQGRKQQKQ
jgi:hypothetical protein